MRRTPEHYVDEIVLWDRVSKEFTTTKELNRTLMRDPRFSTIKLVAKWAEEFPNNQATSESLVECIKYICENCLLWLHSEDHTLKNKASNAFEYFMMDIVLNVLTGTNTERKFIMPEAHANNRKAVQLFKAASLRMQMENNHLHIPLLTKILTYSHEPHLRHIFRVRQLIMAKLAISMEWHTKESRYKADVAMMLAALKHNLLTEPDTSMPEEGYQQAQVRYIEERLAEALASIKAEPSANASAAHARIERWALAEHARNTAPAAPTPSAPPKSAVMGSPDPTPVDAGSSGGGAGSAPLPDTEDPGPVAAMTTPEGLTSRSGYEVGMPTPDPTPSGEAAAGAGGPAPKTLPASWLAPDASAPSSAVPSAPPAPPGHDTSFNAAAKSIDAWLRRSPHPTEMHTSSLAGQRRLSSVGNSPSSTDTGTSSDSSDSHPRSAATRRQPPKAPANPPSPSAGAGAGAAPVRAKTIAAAPKPSPAPTAPKKRVSDTPIFDSLPNPPPFKRTWNDWENTMAYFEWFRGAVELLLTHYNAPLWKGPSRRFRNCNTIQCMIRTMCHNEGVSPEIYSKLRITRQKDISDGFAIFSISCPSKAFEEIDALGPKSLIPYCFSSSEKKEYSHLLDGGSIPNQETLILKSLENGLIAYNQHKTNHLSPAY